MQFLQTCRRYTVDAAIIVGMVMSVIALLVTSYASYHAATH